MKLKEIKNFYNKHLKIKVNGDETTIEKILKNWLVILFWIVGITILLGLLSLAILSILCMVSVIGGIEIGAIKPDLSWVKILGIAYLFKR